MNELTDKIFEALSSAYQSGEVGKILVHCESLMVAIRSNGIVEKLKTSYYEQKEEKE